MASELTEIRQLKQQLKESIRETQKLIAGKMPIGNWVKQDMACAMLNVKPRQMRNIRKHLDKNGTAVGSIRWRKGHGKTVEYFKPDLESYLNKITVA